MEQMQQEYMKFQMLDQQIKQSQKQLQMLEQQTMQLAAANDTVQNIESTETGNEMLMQLSDGIFAKVQLKDNKNLILNVGAKTAVTKDIPSTIKLINSQLDEIKKVQVQLSNEVEQLVSQARILGEKLQAGSK
jgi:prefoldin alpha subunit